MGADVSTDTAPDLERKPLRADAQRNYDKIVETARAVFRERGADASLDEIAKRAGVGPGTLYRHFPTRDALIDTVMRDWADRINADADEAAASSCRRARPSPGGSASSSRTSGSTTAPRPR